MGERKVLNKYIPPDFDPSLVPRGKKLSSKDGTVPVRMMLPFSIQCNTCGSFLYRGTKFNSKKEAMGGPDGNYLGITRWRFYIKCTSCARPLTFLTDPKNNDYEMESGGSRNYELQKDKEQTEQEHEATMEEEAKLDPMKALENRVLDSQREMADMENLEEIKAMNARHLKVEDVHAFLDAREAAAAAKETSEQETDLTAEDEALVKSIQFGKAQMVVKRLGEEDEERLEEERRKQAAALEEQQRQMAQKAVQKKAALPIVKVKRKRAVEDDKKPVQDSKRGKEEKKDQSPSSSSANGLSGLLGGYGSDSSSD